MSTPRTDANCGWPWGHHGRIECSDLRWSPDGPFVHSEVARQLERAAHELEEENRRLHVELDAHHNGKQLRVLRDCVDRTGEANDRLVVENIALRKDKERLDWLITKSPFQVLVNLCSDPVKARQNIDREMEFPTT